MKKITMVALVFCFFCLIYGVTIRPSFAGSTPYCAVTMEGDNSGLYTLRYIFESVINGNNHGGCNIELENEHYNYADNAVAQNLVLFQTPEICSQCNSQVRYFKVGEVPYKNGPKELTINPKQTVMLGNISPDAIYRESDLNDANGDYESGEYEVDHPGYHPESLPPPTDLNLQVLDTDTPDTGFVILDLTAFDSEETKTGISCGADGGHGKKTYLRSMAIASARYLDLESFLADHPCLGNGGDLQYCAGTIKPKSGELGDSDAEYYDPSTTTESSWCETTCSTYGDVYVDADNDGYGSVSAAATNVCLDNGVPTGYLMDHSDCDDTRDDVYPGHYESCDAVDHDCDGSLTGDAIDGTPYYADADADGFGDGDTSIVACEETAGYVSTDGDCDDTNAAVNPGATDVCNDAGLDYNCDGTVVAGSSWYTDADSDGYGDAVATATTACEQPSGSVANNSDCDDISASVNPGATEVCDDSIDQDCSGSDLSCTTPTEDCSDGVDNDEDGSIDCYDSDCTNETVCVPDVEICNDGLDNDYDTYIDCDDPACATWSDCNGVGPEEICDDEIDNDEDGSTDCTDADCAFEANCVIAETETDCADGEDNDADGYVDCFDLDCTDYVVFTETDADGNATELTCYDMIQEDNCALYGKYDEATDTYTCCASFDTDADTGELECVDLTIIGDGSGMGDVSGGCNCDLNASSRANLSQMLLAFMFLVPALFLVPLRRRARR